ncbi:GCN5-related N-acetyltransferase (plasmid) [Gemmatirosa kalamazoonensis]|uniref:GCN5-related N-acetyltransferase n=1 Tax=Gemmatirosa kalamazoonensis TaxID=861299 RepID=W0RP73_9BACT|nr:GNAT family N-acetyltransferase [Gemmatirosa kalamazoonensis]AHG92799.1 GCN5-related N-acetyltransferase [Gemmatirosa kalamazoonensis]
MNQVAIAVCPTLEDDELNALFASAWPAHTPRAYGAVLDRSLAYLAAFVDEELVGFVNVAWDGGAHAFLLDPTVHPGFRRRGIGRELVRRAARLARDRGAVWLHVDYDPALRGFYAAVGFRPTEAALLRLSELER